MPPKKQAPTSDAVAPPKNASNAYMLYANDNRQRVRDTNPELKIGDIGKILGEEWRKIRDAKGPEFARYEKLAAADKLRFERECDAYGGKPKRKTKNRDGSPKRTKAPKDPNAPKKPLSAYILFSNDQRDKVKSEKPELAADNKALMSELGARWRQLDDEAKRPWNKLAAEDKMRYEREMSAREPTLEL